MKKTIFGCVCLVAGLAGFISVSQYYIGIIPYLVFILLAVFGFIISCIAVFSDDNKKNRKKDL